LQLSDGSSVSTHDEMVGDLWLSYKDRLGVSEFTEMFYDLSKLIQSSELPVLDDPFTMDEILAVLEDMPYDHAPGLDGFNGAFIKKCWPIIKDDFFRLCNDFASGNLNLGSINASLITVTPKKDNPQGINDYRPISLLNYSLQFLTKLLANRLQSIGLRVVHATQ
jgi:hypothetical protein